MAKNNNLTDFLTDVADAIRQKEGSSASINPQVFSQRILALQTGGGESVRISLPAKDVNFRDYDGVILYAYSKAEFLALSELPSLPTKDGLICQGWNWTLEDGKSYVQRYGILDVGASYITDDGKTRLYIRIESNERLDLPLYFSQSTSNGVVINWGDGSAEETVEGTGVVNTTHTYTRLGDFLITLKVRSGTLFLGNQKTSTCVFGESGKIRTYSNMLQKVEIGSGVTTMPSGTFVNCGYLSTITIPQNVGMLGESAFEGCTMLSAIVLPKNATVSTNVFRNCRSLKYAILSNKISTGTSYVFQNCSSLQNLVLPEVSSAETLASYFLSNATSLVSLVMPRYIKTINQGSLEYCYSLKLLDMTKVNIVPTTYADSITGFPESCQIIVPYSIYNDWVSHSVWKEYADNIIANYTPQTCLSLDIIADDVSVGSQNVTILHWTAVTNGVMRDGSIAENITLTGSEIIKIGYNKTSESIVKEVSFTYLGLTASTSITQGAYLDNCIVCIYNATSTSSSTYLMYSSFSNFSSYVNSITVDGVAITKAASYKFPSLGYHAVVFKLGTSLPTSFYRMFRDCTSLKYADFSSVDFSSLTSTGTSSGTAYMFYGCNFLTEIILPETTSYLGSSMFYGAVRVNKLTIKAVTAPTVYGNGTWGSSSYYLGEKNRLKGINRLVVPKDSEGYDATGYNYLYNTSYCGFTKEDLENIE